MKNLDIHKENIVDIAQPLNEMVNIGKVMKETIGQIENMLTEWSAHIYKAFKTNGNELSVSLSLKLKGDSQGTNVKTSLSFTTEKITDEREAEIKWNQEKLPLSKEVKE